MPARSRIAIPPPLYPQKGWPSDAHGQTTFRASSLDGVAPLITIVIPSLNQGQFLEQCLRSILFQDYGNFEIIVVDALSQDETGKVASYYAKWIDVFLSEKDSGQSEAVNKGFKLASGEWIVWQNADDFFLPGCFSRLASLLGSSQPADAIYGRTRLLDENGLEIGDGGESEFGLEKMLPWLNLHNQATFFHRSVVKQGHCLNEGLHYCMDLDFFLRLGKNNARFLFVPEYWAIQRIHPRAKGSTAKRGFRSEFSLVYGRIACDVSLPKNVRNKAMQSIIYSAHANDADGYSQLFLADVKWLLKHNPWVVVSSTLFPKLILKMLKF
jgi:glycosyltransferase involved in cell wall biosynthesis